MPNSNSDLNELIKFNVPMQSVGELVRLTSACTNCRGRKVKCSGGSPCATCQRQQKQCLYPASRRGKRSKPTQRSLAQEGGGQYTAFDTTNSNAQVYGARSALPLTPSHTSPDTNEGRNGELLSGLTYPSQGSTLGSNSGSGTRDIRPTSQFLTSNISPDLLSPIQAHYPLAEPGPSGAREREDLVADGEEGVIPLPKVHWEHHGPWSWVSVCSRPGLRWVCERTRSDEFVEIANGLTKTWSRRLKMKRFQPLRKKAAEPDKETAWKYVDAYFEQSYDAVFGILHRPTFEARLRAHFDPHGALPVEDSSWFALRNIVYAAGCRCVLANDPTVSFVDADAQVTQFFHNALSVFSEIIFGHSGFTAVQALALMTFFAEGLGSPAVEYPLCTNAVQLAQAKGLHREPSKSWGLPQSDVLNRSWLWWAIYCLEKQIAFRSGRPSVIDDDNISTPIPTKAPPGSTIDVEVFTLIIKHAQISAQISRRIMSVEAFKQSSAEAMDTIHDIHRQLLDLLESIPPQLQVKNAVRHEYPANSRRVHTIYLHFAIYGSLMATHIIFFYPWISLRFGTESDPKFQNQVVSSSETIATAARQIILVLRSITTDVAIPAWLAFYYPMYAHINLFVYILRYPSLSTARADLALLDICAGHFGHVEHVTNSEISFHFPRESAVLCSRMVKAVKGTEKENATAPVTPQEPGSIIEIGRAPNRQDESSGSLSTTFDMV
ncbi:uncharacterized protein Z518_04740 [Rhinocladiella mackenziei CBS 650.93]|uniref:Zn(2)-C6 fungal-type domain-containing protein n=1 Tax=Rhinocladiella mackenziei CBS 650.93 TaxID=1442369 RepID=A0A0D2ILX1_9EURO|nr:uncharacterized protein Z518_04740 [Rhinocladiella mackenziei CBS 650.93]KIX06764.1 hypothetical protein Z518_04740 [Rhinocladiella mackenziei CBS 650.93]